MGSIGARGHGHQYGQRRCESAAPRGGAPFVDFLFSKPGQLKLREMNRIPSREDVDPDPPRLFRGFKKIIQDLENDTMEESVELYQKIFNLTHQ